MFAKFSNTKFAKESIFRPSDEVATHLFTVSALAVFFLQIFVFPNWPGLLSSRQISFLGNVIFFNGTHVMLTFVMLYALPEGRRFLSDKSQKSFLSCGLSYSALMILLIILLSVVITLSMVSKNILPYFTVRRLTGDLLIFFTATFHGLWQIRGISQIYNETLKPGQSKTQLECWQNREKRFISMLFISICGAKILRVCGLSLSLQYGCAAIGYFLCLCTLWNARNITGSWVSLKSLYLLRLLVFPMTGLSPFAYLVTCLFHGTEYIFFYRRFILEKIDVGLRKKLITYGVAGVAFQSIFVAAHICFYFGEPWTHMVIGYTWGVSITHFYLDRQIFKMKDSIARQNFGRFLRI